MLMPDNVVDVLNTLSNAGFSAFLVGGSVRDALLSATPHDFDVTTSATPAQLLDLFPGSRHTNKFGTVVVLDVEVTTFRTDQESSDHRHPDAVTFGVSLVDDLARRDFTVNAMAMDVNGNVIDLHGGQDDLRARVLRTVGDPFSRFNEDALRLLRAVRLAAKLDLSVDLHTFRAMCKMHADVAFVAKERQGDELRKMLDLPADQRSRAIALLNATGLLNDVLPNAQVDMSVDLAGLTVRATLAHLLRNSSSFEIRNVLLPLGFGKVLTDEVVVLTNGMLAQPFDPSDPVSVRRFMFTVGRGNVAEVMFLTGQNTLSHMRAVLDQTHCPLTLGELAVNGHDVTGRGVRGPNVSRVLDTLMAKVVFDPSLNTREKLMKEF